MELVTTPRVTFLRTLADEILAQYGRGRMIVAIDGPLRSGKTEFADDLAAVLRERGHCVFRASMERFHRSRAAQDEYGDDTPARGLSFSCTMGFSRTSPAFPIKRNNAYGHDALREQPAALGHEGNAHDPVLQVP